MSVQLNASEAPEAPAKLADAKLKDVFPLEEESMKVEAENIKKVLKRDVVQLIIEADDEERKKYFENTPLHPGPISQNWVERMEKTNNFDDLDTDTLGGIVELHADLTQFKKDLKQYDVNEIKMELRSKRDEINKKSEKLSEHLANAKKLSEDIYELQAAIDALDEDLFVARDKRRYRDNRLAKRFKTYLLNMHLPPAPNPEPKWDQVIDGFKGYIETLTQQGPETFLDDQTPPSSDSDVVSSTVFEASPPPPSPPPQPKHKPRRRAPHKGSRSRTPVATPGSSSG